MLIGLHERHALPVPRNAATPFNAVPREALNLVRRGEWLVSSEPGARDDRLLLGRSRAVG